MRSRIPSKLTVSSISIFGLGKLGAPIAAAIASRGYHVTGVDVDPRIVRAINEGRPPVFEPGLEGLLCAHGERLSASLDGTNAVLNSDATFIVVPTPSEADGAFSLRFLLEACCMVAAGLRVKNQFHSVVVTSTVMPGATGGEVRSCLETESGKTCGTDFGLCYSPEFVALGSVIHDFLYPDFVLIGESDQRSGDWLQDFYRTVCQNTPPVARTSLINAELAKISLNAFVTMKIGFANMLARMCERTPGADVDAVTSAIGLDSRIGPRYLKGAVGYGGPCFPRDNRALSNHAHSVGASAGLAEATDSSNRYAVDELASLVGEHLPPGGTVGILGLAYKPNTDVVEEAQGLLLAQTLVEKGTHVVAYDPAAMGNAQNHLKGLVELAGSMDTCVEAADVIVLVTPWDEFHSVDWLQFARTTAPRILIDCWRMISDDEIPCGIEHICLGMYHPSLGA
jgi:UDPglucose 6-dehydrogenase